LYEEKVTLVINVFRYKNVTYCYYVNFINVNSIALPSCDRSDKISTIATRAQCERSIVPDEAVCTEL